MCEQFEQIKELAHMLGSWSNARGSLGMPCVKNCVSYSCLKANESMLCQLVVGLV